MAIQAFGRTSEDQVFQGFSVENPAVYLPAQFEKIVEFAAGIACTEKIMNGG